MTRLRALLDRARRDEAGSTLLITICYGVLGLAIVLVVVSATSLYLERKRLFTLADGAALAAAESWGAESVRIADGGFAFDLSDEAVGRAASEYLADAPTDLHELAIVRATAPDGETASVTLRSVWVAPLGLEWLPVSVPIEVTATARSVFH